MVILIPEVKMRKPRHFQGWNSREDWIARVRNGWENRTKPHCGGFFLLGHGDPLRIFKQKNNTIQIIC